MAKFTANKPGGSTTSSPTNTKGKSEFDEPESKGWEGLDAALDAMHDVLTLLPHIYLWVTGRGAAILYGIATIYFVFVSAEGYWQVLDPGAPSFVLKPYGGDDANPLDIVVAAISISFWFSFLFSAVINAIQARVFRGIAINIAKQRLKEVEGEVLPDKPKKAIDIVGVRWKQYKRAGMLEIRKQGFVILSTYAVDIIMSYQNHPFGYWLGVTLSRLVWFILSVVAAELAGSMFWDAVEDFNRTRKTKTAD
jgi:uncharacterized protein involved in cysteine biosynthesis